ncbi:uncharacterized protein LOC134256900 isoform X2 [Saccostrea cucullata]|uniref:uncharacterized protein LOC134256900 isoform X2 n=1 Tax=Saccostrea cuccullata TaxID=36930 RepID=UPI002ED1B511
MDAISRHCAEYNFLGKIIQTNHEAKCKQCPKIYNSGDVYKYQECYNFTRQQSDETTESGNSKWNITANNTKMNFQDASHPQDKSTNAATIFVIILGVLLAFFVFLSLAFLIWKRKKRQKRRSQELNPDLPNTSDPGCDIELIPKDDGSSNSREENLDDSKSCKQTRCVLEDSVMKCVKCCVSFETRDDNKFREENNDEDDIIHKKQYLKPMYTISASEIN